MAAFQALGAFILTFADPTATGLRLDGNGHVIYTDLPEGSPEDKR